jgi:hypothetical protein
MMVTRCAVVVLLLVGLPARAAIVSAKSPEFRDVSSAIHAASAGDTVMIPAGTSTWTRVLALAKPITLKGAGTNATRIVNGIGSKAWYSNEKAAALIEVTVVRAPYRITEIMFDGRGIGCGIEILGAPSPAGRIDHCLLYRHSAYAFQSFGQSEGVIDHCTFTDNQAPVSINGDNQSAWLRPVGLGTIHQWVIEDCLFFMTGASYAPIAGDGSYGARYTWRYNACTNYSGNNGIQAFDTFVENHGNQGPPNFSIPLTHRSVIRSVVCFEGYNNIFSTATANAMFAHRGGTLIFFGNQAFCQDPSCVLSVYKNVHWCNEEDGWRAGNAPFTKWPPYDGITNSYIWNEKVNGHLAPHGGLNLHFAGTTPCLGSYNNELRCPEPHSDGIFIQAKRDYWLRPPSTNFYKPLRYPHPRVLTDNDPPVPRLFALISPANGAAVSTTPLLSWAASEMATGYVIQIAPNYYMSPLTYSASVDARTTSHTPPGGVLSSNSIYFWRVLATGVNGTTESGSINTADVRSFTIGTAVNADQSQVPDAPENLSPRPGTTGVAMTFWLNGFPYSHPTGAAQTGAEFLLLDATGTNLVWDSGNVGVTNAVLVPQSVLTSGAKYGYKLRYQSAAGWSDYSDVTTFSMIAGPRERKPDPGAGRP